MESKMDFSNIEVGDEVWVEPAYSGPFSGSGWETVIKVKKDHDRVSFKTSTQWFWQDGRAKTSPLAYIATSKRTPKHGKHKI